MLVFLPTLWPRVSSLALISMKDLDLAVKGLEANFMHKRRIFAQPE